MEILVEIVVGTLHALSLVVIADALLSWVQGPDQMPRKMTRALTEPMYAPIHRVISPQMTGGFDLSPLLMIIFLNFLASVLSQAMA